jgi:hypothetical protein
LTVSSCAKAGAAVATPATTTKDASSLRIMSLTPIRY